LFSLLGKLADQAIGYILLALVSFFFITFFNDRSENNYLRIRWTNFRNLFTE